MSRLHCWSHLLKGTTIPVLVFTDHTNLQYYQEPRKIGPCIAGYLPEREQYNIILEYKPGAKVGHIELRFVSHDMRFL